MIYSVLNREFRAALERGNYTYHATSGSAFGSLEGGTTKEKLSLALVINLLVSLSLVGVLIRVTRFTWWAACGAASAASICIVAARDA